TGPAATRAWPSSPGSSGRCAPARTAWSRRSTAGSSNWPARPWRARARGWWRPGPAAPQRSARCRRASPPPGPGTAASPAPLARELARHPGLSCCYGRPLGPHPALQDIVAARIDDVLAGAPRRDTHVVLAGRGSTDPDANAEIAKVARLLWEGRGYAGVEFCFISLAEPSVPAALHRAVLLGARRIVVA